MSNDQVLSLVDAWNRQTSPRGLIHQLLNSVALERGGELSGPFLVAALGELGHRPPAVRQMLRRMLGTDELEMRRDGRVNHYRLAPFSLAGAETGRRKLLGRPLEDWDGQWTMALYQFRASEREMRDHVRVLLSLEGFGQLARGVFLHPRDRVKSVTTALAAIQAADRVHLFRAARSAGPSDPETAARAWDLAAIADGYRVFDQRFRELDPTTLSPAACFRAAPALVTEFLDIAFRDPDLPPALLPSDWPGRAAQAQVMRLLPVLHAGVLVHAEGLAP